MHQLVWTTTCRANSTSATKNSGRPWTRSWKGVRRPAKIESCSASGRRTIGAAGAVDPDTMTTHLGVTRIAVAVAGAEGIALDLVLPIAPLGIEVIGTEMTGTVVTGIEAIGTEVTAIVTGIVATAIETRTESKLAIIDFVDILCSYCEFCR